MARRLRLTAAAVLGVLAVSLSAAACASAPPPRPNGNQQESNQQQQDTNSIMQSQPLPHYNWSQYRQVLIDAETMQANGTQTTTFFMNNGEPNPVFSCPSLGMPVAVNASLSNPQQLVNDPNADYSISQVVQQQDPNGVYASPSSTGTYVLCVNAQGQPYLMYWEGNVLTAGAGAIWQNGQLVVNGAPTYKITTSATK